MLTAFANMFAKKLFCEGSSGGHFAQMAGYSQTSIIHMLVGILFFGKFVASMDTQRTSAFSRSSFLFFFSCLVVVLCSVPG